ncbi:MAG: esterase family protein [Bacteroidetes bacterium]|nr:MAG: esterase family protein [Bacteroidota bacterium]
MPAQPGWTGTPVATGSVREGLALESDILGEDVHFSIYLPPDYEQSSRRYPAVYLLHGYSDDETAWVQFGEVNATLDRGIAARELPPMIVVMPDAKVTWYINTHDGQTRWEDMFIQELIPHIDASYRTRAKKEFRGISGLSMGGHGSLVLAMKHPDLFAACAAFSAAVYLPEDFAQLDDARYARTWATIFGEGLAGEARLTDHWRQNMVYGLAQDLPVETLRQVRWYIDCGDDDFLYAGNSQLHILWRQREVPHEYRIRDGAHNWTYWRTWIGQGLQFIGDSFHR